MEIIRAILHNKGFTKKHKAQQIADALANEEIGASTLLVFAKGQNDKIKTICMEALEYLSKDNASVISTEAFAWAIKCLKQSDPSLKRESARVIGNSAVHHKHMLEAAIRNLIPLTEDQGTIVRWAAAYAISSIMSMKTKWNEELLPIVHSILETEENNGVRSQYLKVLKKLM